MFCGWRGSIQIEYTLARLGADRLWNLMHTDAYVPAALGSHHWQSGPIEMVQAGLKADLWERLAGRRLTATPAGDVYSPTRVSILAISAPNLVKRINRRRCFRA